MYIYIEKIKIKKVYKNLKIYINLETAYKL